MMIMKIIVIPIKDNCNSTTANNNYHYEYSYSNKNNYKCDFFSKTSLFFQIYQVSKFFRNLLTEEKQE